MAIPLAVVAVGGALYQGYQQRQLARSQEEAQRVQNDSIRASVVDQYNDLSPAERDIMQRSSEEGLAQQVEYLQARGRVNALAGASGTYGGSIDNQLRDLRRNNGRNLQTIRDNRDTQLAEVETQARQIRSAGTRQLGNRSFFKPSAGLIALQAASAGANAYVGARSGGFENFSVGG